MRAGRLSRATSGCRDHDQRTAAETTLCHALLRSIAKEYGWPDYRVIDVTGIVAVTFVTLLFLAYWKLGRRYVHKIGEVRTVRSAGYLGASPPPEKLSNRRMQPERRFQQT